MRYKLTIAYEGSRYCGWQIQDNGNTVEAEVRKAIRKLFGETYEFNYSSRTDSGVHALGQVATLDVDTKIPLWQLPYALNAHLPEDIVIQEVTTVHSDFHPRYDATYKTYRYRIYNDKFMNPLYNASAYFIHQPLNIEEMKEASSYFLGEHNFMAFSSSGSSVVSTIRTIHKIEFDIKEQLIDVYVTGSGFLYNMVRIMIGGLVQVGLGFYEADFIKEILEKNDRSLIKRVAPAKGLTLMNISYEAYAENLDL